MDTELSKHIIFHSTSRDGWGSAALLVATLGVDQCEVYPTVLSRDLLAGLGRDPLPTPEQKPWVLDLAVPGKWPKYDPPGQRVTWVDHHLSSWRSAPPHWVHAVLPPDTQPSSSMSLLLRSELARVPQGQQLMQRLFSEADDPWGLVFDGLYNPGDMPFTWDDLPELIAPAALGAPVPKRLSFAIEAALHQRAVVADLLAACPIEEHPGMLVTHVRDSRFISHKPFHRALAGRFPGRVIVIVWQRALTCTRDPGAAGLDFIAHFEARGARVTGHPYACMVWPSRPVRHELQALAAQLAARAESEV